ncbi:AraC family transcriptional regulator [Nocardiopsis suaedae]|uniref:AraC family transcriptional regulator n=1 Tax=Nocardiopsis suaedae TaxID=3018444 RepID=A0ABT4TGL0_9ACTN|nr:AraC family transcriptional regulator [Nocardiopsis suaedae]MDA2803834.1 AraC family transcriptional regulator [Nocardiopsis suaedae]
MAAHPALELHRLEVPSPHLLPFAVGTFDSIGPLSRADYPHRHTFHEIVLVTSGTGLHVVDTRPLPVTPPNLGVLAAGQVHHWQGARGLDGYVLLLEDAFLLDRPDDRDLLRRLAAERTWTALGPREHAEAAAVVTEIAREFDERRPGMATVVRALLHVLLVRAARPPGAGGGAAGGAARADDGADLRPDAPESATGLAGRYLDTLEGPAALEAGATVERIADTLGVTPGHLGEAVKRATGRTPGALLRQARLLEAKRLLACTRLTVAAVARASGFTDPAYFCRFFRRETGTTPGAFRTAARIDTGPAASTTPPAERPSHTGGDAA